MLLASNYGNTFSIAIEVTSSPLVDQELWEEFKEAMAANWGNYSDQVSVIIIIHSIILQMTVFISIASKDHYKYQTDLHQQQFKVNVIIIS